jgi:4-alpha-glucanotransferase
VKSTNRDQGRRVEQLAELYGIQAAYTDVEGKRQRASEETLRILLAARGADIRSARAIESSIRRRAADLSPLVEPVVVAWGGRRISIPFRPASRTPTDDVRLIVTGEEGGEWSASARRGDLEVRATRGEYACIMRGRFPSGYYRYRLTAGRRSGEGSLFVAPKLAYEPPGAQRRLGVFAPLYALHSEGSWGVGDLRDLKILKRWAERNGSAIVGTLPLLALFLDERFEPSPYAPVSRTFWNELYLDVPAIPEFQKSVAVRERMQSNAFQEALRNARSGEFLAYRDIYRLKREILQLLADFFFESGDGERRVAFQRFRRATPELAPYAVFRARVSGARGAERKRVAQYHEYVQWNMEEQVAALPPRSADGSRGLYLDFPLGTNRDGFEVARHPELFIRELSAGAPPDFAYREGQNWGFPPFDAGALRADGYAHLIECIRFQMRHAALLRIDHVMGLHRLYCIPEGEPADRGAYLTYHADEMYAVLLIESHRNRTALVGEDLGTVPSYVRSAIDRHHLRRLFVVQRQLSREMLLPSELPGNVVASLNNHDMPPFATFWRGDDIDDRKSLGLLDEDRAAEERERRETIRRRVVSLLARRRLTRAGGKRKEQITTALLRFLARSRAWLVLVGLEDLWGETISQNTPTTTWQRPNWRHRFRYAIEQIVGSKTIPAILEELQSQRSQDE